MITVSSPSKCHSTIGETSEHSGSNTVLSAQDDGRAQRLPNRSGDRKARCVLGQPHDTEGARWWALSAETTIFRAPQPNKYLQPNCNIHLDIMLAASVVGSLARSSCVQRLTKTDAALYDVCLCSGQRTWPLLGAARCRGRSGSDTTLSAQDDGRAQRVSRAETRFTRLDACSGSRTTPRAQDGGRPRRRPRPSAATTTYGMGGLEVDRDETVAYEAHVRWISCSHLSFGAGFCRTPLRLQKPRSDELMDSVEFRHVFVWHSEVDEDGCRLIRRLFIFRPTPLLGATRCRGRSGSDTTLSAQDDGRAQRVSRAETRFTRLGACSGSRTTPRVQDGGRPRRRLRPSAATTTFGGDYDLPRTVIYSRDSRIPAALRIARNVGGYLQANQCGRWPQPNCNEHVDIMLRSRFWGRLPLLYEQGTFFPALQKPRSDELTDGVEAHRIF
ncbi:hypothetical protein C8R47DRAFT_1067798 [Mycena vitilis]|nr:hypothetical protein C8R47DRAFT_1067798 [Mycena vitilis]